MEACCSAPIARYPVIHFHHISFSDVSSIAYPAVTVLDGIRSWVLRDRLLFPLHRIRGSVAAVWNMLHPCIRGQEFHLHENQVIKDLFGLCPSSLTLQSFRGNDSQSLVPQRDQRINLRRPP